MVFVLTSHDQANSREVEPAVAAFDGAVPQKCTGFALDEE
jgi:hypothetical protein